MPSVLLLFTNEEYATSLAETIDSLSAEYDVDVLSRVPLSNRMTAVLNARYDLIHVDELLVNGVLASASSFVSGTPVVASIRGWADYTNAHDQYGRFRDLSIYLRTKFCLERTDATVFLSSQTLEQFEERYDLSDSYIIGRPIDIGYYRGAEDDDTFGRASERQEMFQLLTVTNLRYREKLDGVKTTLRGLKDVFEANEQVRYSIAGDGPYLEQLREFVNEYPYSDRVDILGFREDVPALLADADAFIYISYLDAYPTVVLEAQAAGLPVIGGDAVGVPEAVGDAGLVCPPTPEGVRESVSRILDDEELRTELRRKSEAKMMTYNRRCAERHVDVWNDVLGHS